MGARKKEKKIAGWRLITARKMAAVHLPPLFAAALQTTPVMKGSRRSAVSGIRGDAASAPVIKREALGTQCVESQQICAR